MISFDNKVAAITGAGSGIGQALALQLAGQGCVVAIADKNPEGLEATRRQVESIGGQCSAHELDVADRFAVEAFAADVVSTHGRVHMVFNNAGVTLVDRVETLDIADFEWLMNINFWGVVYGTKAFLPYLHQVDEAHIVNISSIFGIMAVPTQATYNASKFAVKGFTEALKFELAATSIGVNCVHPGGIRTGIARNSRVGQDAVDVSREEMEADFQKLARTTSAQAAKQILRGVRKNRRRILVGLDAKIMDWVVRHFPNSYEKIFRLEAAVKRNAAARAAKA